MPKKTNPADSQGRGRHPRSGRSQGGPPRKGGGRPGRPPAPPREPGVQMVLVQFKGHRKSYYHNRRKLELKPGQYCLVEADRGRDLGRVTYVGEGKDDWWPLASQQGVLGLADARDLERLHNNRGDEWEFWDICQEKIQYRKLNMNLVSVERQFDHKKITFYFTAEKRVDFRELVRDLAAVFRTRIELRQIGVRDEARLKGGIGVCGREFCCASFLDDFVPVTLKMAKTQQLPLNPGKLSGPCGRLRCCMAYEQTVYLELLRGLPRVGSEVQTPKGRGHVRRLDLLVEEVTVEVPGLEDWQLFKADELKWNSGEELPRPRESGSGAKERGSGPRRGGSPGGPTH
jgi:cell fate regulator YaaT (PSP1 superfamily)